MKCYLYACRAAATHVIAGVGVCAPCLRALTSIENAGVTSSLDLMRRISDLTMGAAVTPDMVWRVMLRYDWGGYPWLTEGQLHILAHDAMAAQLTDRDRAEWAEVRDRA